MKNKHTETPWAFDFMCSVGHIKSIANLEEDSKGRMVTPTVCRYDVVTPSLSEEERKANAERIVTCVNSLNGISNKALEGGVVDEMVEFLKYRKNYLVNDAWLDSILSKLEDK